MRLNSILIFSFLFLTQLVNSQTKDSIVRKWNGFYQRINISKYSGCDFELSADVRVLATDSLSNAYLFLSIQNKKGWRVSNFNSIPQKEKEKKGEWTSYNISGNIKKSGVEITIGGLFENRGSYCFDNFRLRIKDKKGAWHSIHVENHDFSDSIHPWKEFDRVKGFKLTSKRNTTGEHDSFLYVDGSTHFSYGNNPNTGKYAEVNGINIYYETYGTGKPLILLHGNSQSIADYNKQIPILAEHFQVIAFDTRGHGKSTADDKQLSYELFATDVEAMVKYLQLDSVNILGWSDGGNTGLRLAIDKNIHIRKLAIMGSNLYNKRSSVKPLINVFVKMKSRKLKKEHKEETFEHKLVQLLLNEPNISSEEIQKIDCQTLVMAGSNDVIKERHTKLIQKNIPDSELLILDKSNHLAPQYNANVFNEAVLNFFLKPQ